MRFTPLIWFALAGMVIGYLLVHPFAMLAYILGPQHPHTPMEISLWGQQARLSFSSDMLAMGAAFSFMGGVAGFGLGAWYLQRERLAAAKLESERRLTAITTLQELMVTLAHYIRNANVVIGGFSLHLQKHLREPELKRQLELIHQASCEIESVIASLESLTEIEHEQYISRWKTQMIDLKEELESRLQAAKVKENHDPQ